MRAWQPGGAPRNAFEVAPKRTAPGTKRGVNLSKPMNRQKNRVYGLRAYGGQLVNIHICIPQTALTTRISVSRVAHFALRSSVGSSWHRNSPKSFPNDEPP